MLEQIESLVQRIERVAGQLRRLPPQAVGLEGMRLCRNIADQQLRPIIMEGRQLVAQMKRELEEATEKLRQAQGEVQRPTKKTRKRTRRKSA